MERSTKKHRVYLKNKKLRSRLKKCLGRSLHKQVPYEIWQQILKACPLQTMGTLAQLCRAFEEFVEEYRRSTFKVALEYRREGQIALARKYLRICAMNDDQEAMFHLAVGYAEAGWGLKQNHSTKKRWLEKLWKLNNTMAMAYYALGLHTSNKSTDRFTASHIRHKLKGTTGCGYFEKGILCIIDAGLDYRDFVPLLEKSAEEEDNEFAQTILARHYIFDVGNVQDELKFIHFALKAATKGNEAAQRMLRSRFKNHEDFSWFFSRSITYQRLHWKFLNAEAIKNKGF